MITERNRTKHYWFILACVLAFVLIVLVGCEKTETAKPEFKHSTPEMVGNTTVGTFSLFDVERDGCEYIVVKSYQGLDMEHKPSCKSCLERNKNAKVVSGT